MASGGVYVWHTSSTNRVQISTALGSAGIVQGDLSGSFTSHIRYSVSLVKSVLATLRVMHHGDIWAAAWKLSLDYQGMALLLMMLGDWVIKCMTAWLSKWIDGLAFNFVQWLGFQVAQWLELLDGMAVDIVWCIIFQHTSIDWLSILFNGLDFKVAMA